MNAAQQVRILEVSGYPPPRTGWGVRISFVRAQLEAEGHHCQVLNIGQSRKIRSREYLDVQSGPDFVRKLVRHVQKGYLVHAHLNGDSPKGLVLALIAEFVSLTNGRRCVLTFHAGPEQRFFPRRRSRLMAPLFRLAFALPRRIICNDEAVKARIVGYGVLADKIVPIQAFSRQYLQYVPAALPAGLEEFLARIHRVAMCYFFFRPEFSVESVFEAAALALPRLPGVGLVLVGADTVGSAVTRMVDGAGLRGIVYQAGDLPHDQFMSLLARAHLFIRTPKKDGVCSSVLEALSLGVPVLAAENQRRPPSVLTYRAGDSRDLAEQMRYVFEKYEAVRSRVVRPLIPDTVKEEAGVLVTLASQ